MLEYMSPGSRSVNMSQPKGIVYVLTNPAMPGLVKIGKTNRRNLGKRLAELYSTGVPVPFECHFAGTVEDADEVEKRFHKAFAPYRFNPKREFFQIEPDQAIALLELLILKDVTDSVSQQAAKVDVESKVAADKLRSRRPNFNFAEMEIEVGAELIFTRGEEHQCRVVDEHKVEYDGDVYSLTALTTELLGSKYSVQPTPYWTYQGRTLKEIYDKVYMFG